jgi:hypothetical protein
MILGETLTAIGTSPIFLTGEESWFHRFRSEMKHYRMEWNHTVSVKKKKARTVTSYGKSVGKFSRIPRGTYLLISCPERKLSVQFAVFRHSTNCDMDFVISP